MARTIILFAFALGSFTFPGAAFAENITGTTLEWLTCESEIVAVGRVEKITTTRGPGDVFYEDCTVEVKETIKGKVEGGRLVFCVRTLGAASPAKTWMKSSEPILMFLSMSQRHGGEKHLDGMLIPISRQFPYSVIDLAAPGKDVFDTGFNVLKDPKSILGTCRKTAAQQVEYLKRNPNGKVEFKRVEVLPDSEAWRSLDAGSAVHLKVPVFGPQGRE